VKLVPAVEAFPSAAEMVSWAGVCPGKQPDCRETEARQHERW